MIATERGIPAWEWELDTGSVTWSEAMYELHGISPTEFGGRPEDYVPLVHPDDRPRVEEIIRHLIEGGDPRPLEYRIVRPDGQVRLVLGTNRLLDDGDGGGGRRIVGTVRDISQLRQESLAREPVEEATVDGGEARRALRHSEERFRALVEHSFDVITVFDSDGTVLYTTPSIERVLGYAPEEMIGRPGHEIIHPDDLEEANRAFTEARSRPFSTVHVIHRARHKDGGYRLVEITGTNLLHDEAVRGMVSNLRDITEREEAEIKLRQAHKMEAVGRLAGGVAHDFNNLLTVILGEVEMALASGTVPEEVVESLDRIRHSGERAAALTHQLLSFSRKEIAQPTVFDLNDLLEREAEMLRRLIEENVTLEIDAADDLWPLRADRSQVEQLVMNLVVNARDSMPDGGAIAIRTANAVVDEASAPAGDCSPGEYVRLQVCDEGVGMPEELRAHIFEPFFSTKGERGTGLGLATCYGVAQQHDGHIEVESAEGSGTTVTVLLPRWRGEAPQTDDRSAARSANGAETILIVEDEEAVRTIASEMLRRAGYTVLTASKTREALAIADEHPGEIDLLLTDVVLPGRNGRELAEEIAQKEPGMRVLFASGYTADQVIRRGVVDREIDLIQKPFTAAQLVARVRAALDR